MTLLDKLENNVSKSTPSIFFTVSVTKCFCMLTAYHYQARSVGDLGVGVFLEKAELFWWIRAGDFP